MRHKILYVRAVCLCRYVILDIREVGREINSYRVLYFCDVDRIRPAAGGGAIENVIIRRAFSPQLTERTGPEAAGPRNDDTFHEGCNVSAKGSPSTRPVDGSFVYYRDRPTTIDRSIYLSHRGHRVYYVAVPGFISGACRTNRDSDLLSKQSGDAYTPAVFASPFDSSPQLSFSELSVSFLSQRDDISREPITEIAALIISEKSQIEI